MKPSLPKKTLLILAGVVVLVSVGFAFLLLLPKTPPEEVPLSFSQKLHFLLDPILHFQTSSIQEQVLAALEKKLEFCEVVNQKDLENRETKSRYSKEFQLICNGRPFSALWENEKISYELNGWSFLKEQPEVLKELQDNHCRFYQTSQDNLLVFVCQDEKVRKYSYSTPDFQLTKQEEVPFTDAIVGQLFDATLLPCDFPTLDKTSHPDYWAIKMKCRENSPATIYFDPEKLFFTLPVITDENLTDREKVKKSIEILQLKSCNLSFQQEIDKGLMLAVLACNQTSDLSIFYDLKLGVANSWFEKEKFVDSYPLVAQYGHPFLKEIKVEKLISEQEEPPQSFYYLSNKRVVIGGGLGGEGVFSQVYLKDESFE